MISSISKRKKGGGGSKKNRKRKDLDHFDDDAPLAPENDDEDEDGADDINVDIDTVVKKASIPTRRKRAVRHVEGDEAEEDEAEEDEEEEEEEDDDEAEGVGDDEDDVNGGDDEEEDEEDEEEGDEEEEDDEEEQVDGVEVEEEEGVDGEMEEGEEDGEMENGEEIEEKEVERRKPKGRGKRGPGKNNGGGGAGANGATGRKRKGSAAPKKATKGARAFANRVDGITTLSREAAREALGTHAEHAIFAHCNGDGFVYGRTVRRVIEARSAGHGHHAVGHTPATACEVRLGCTVAQRRQTLAKIFAPPVEPKHSDAYFRIEDPPPSGLVCRKAKCRSEDVFWWQRQLRSGDEGMTVFYMCQKCFYEWRQR